LTNKEELGSKIQEAATHDEIGRTLLLEMEHAIEYGGGTVDQKTHAMLMFAEGMSS